VLLICRFVRDSRGTSGLEYGLIASIIIVAIACAVTSFDIDFDRVFKALAKAIGHP
jgi:Flp pilus assembly pilin Flp